MGHGACGGEEWSFRTRCDNWKNEVRVLKKYRLQEAARIFLAHGASEVYLFGSHARGRTTSCSDADFAVSGLAPKAFFRALGGAMEALGRPVDLVDLDQSTPFTEYLKSHGELVRVA